MAKTTCPNCGECTSEYNLNCKHCNYSRDPQEDISPQAIERVVTDNYPVVSYMLSFLERINLWHSN